jgi:hypothetical protein
MKSFAMERFAMSQKLEITRRLDQEITLVLRVTSSNLPHFLPCASTQLLHVSMCARLTLEQNDQLATSCGTR